MAMRLTDVESCSSGDTARSLLSVRKRIQDRKLSVSSNSHSDDSLLPASNNLTRPRVNDSYTNTSQSIVRSGERALRD